MMLRTATATLTVLLLTVITSTPAAADRPGSYDNVLGGSASRSPTSLRAGVQSPRHGLGHVRGRSSICLGVGLPFGYVAPPIISYGAYYPTLPYPAWSPYGIYYNPSLNVSEFYLPPTYVPGELFYGPQAVDRFMGVRRTPPVIPPAVPAAPATVKPTSIVDNLRKSNATAQERARRFISFGDALFLKQRFHEAAQRYKSAIEIAPDMPESYYRQGFALLTVKQYRLAAKALRIAVELDPGMLRHDKLVKQLYGDNHLVKEAHVEQLASAALENPKNGDLFFLLGTFLGANDEWDRSLPFLREAYELADPKPDFLAPLLVPERPEPVEFDT